MRIPPAVQFLNTISNIPAQGGVPQPPQAQAPEAAKQAEAARSGANRNKVPGQENSNAAPPANAPRGSIIDIIV